MSVICADWPGLPYGFDGQLGGCEKGIQSRNTFKSVADQRGLMSDITRDKVRVTVSRPLTSFLRSITTPLLLIRPMVPVYNSIATAARDSHTCLAQPLRVDAVANSPPSLLAGLVNTFLLSSNFSSPVKPLSCVKSLKSMSHAVSRPLSQVSSPQAML